MGRDQTRVTISNFPTQISRAETYPLYRLDCVGTRESKPFVRRVRNKADTKHSTSRRRAYGLLIGPNCPDKQRVTVCSYDIFTMPPGAGCSACSENRRTFRDGSSKERPPHVLPTWTPPRSHGLLTPGKHDRIPADSPQKRGSLRTRTHHRWEHDTHSAIPGECSYRRV